MRYIVTFLSLLFTAPIFAQHAKDSLTINGLQVYVASDGNLDSLMDASRKKILNATTQLWLAGYDNSALCVAAQTNRLNGLDFQPGPISTDTNARHIYNKVWKINRTTIDSFAAGLYNGVVPNAILNWPAHGNTTHGESFYLAPFVDVNQNGFYNPALDGDYPCIAGDQAIFFVFNDDCPHTNTQAQSLGIEVLGLAYGYASSGFLDSVIFVEYTMRNKKKTLTGFHVSAYADFDLGNATDDICGTFADQNTVIAYNADHYDQGLMGFGLNPPATGLTVLSGIKTNLYDGLDNDKDGCTDGVRDTNGICQAINAALNIVESWKLSSAIYSNNTSSNTGNPTAPIDFYNYARGLWRNGFPIRIETPAGFMNAANGDGYSTDTTLITTSFAFSGNSYDTSAAFFPLAPQNWFASPANAQDVRMIAGMGKMDTLAIGEELHIKIALFMARDSTTINSYDAAYQMAQNINTFVDTVPVCSGSWLISVEEIPKISEFKLYPNPANDYIVIAALNANHAEAQIVNSVGIIVDRVRLEDTKTVINTSHLPAGIYFVIVGQRVAKFVVSR